MRKQLCENVRSVTRGTPQKRENLQRVEWGNAELLGHGDRSKKKISVIARIGYRDIIKSCGRLHGNPQAKVGKLEKGLELD
jgi:hypothetical protein